MTEIPLSQGKIALIDDDDAELVLPHTWHAIWSKLANTWYAKTRILSPEPRGQVYLHRFITGAKRGFDVHHENHNGLDNQRSNLRVCPRRLNAKHRSPNRSKMASRFKGVCWDKSRSRWMAQITVDWKRKTIGRFATEEEAALAYDAVAVQFFGEFALLNASLFPELLKEGAA